MTPLHHQHHLHHHHHHILTSTCPTTGDDSNLHIIIFDEIDSICKQRGSNKDGTGVHDTVVNQLLSKIDGVNSLNNILIIGMTNRKDMIDEALLRPGRLGVQVEISLPDEAGYVAQFGAILAHPV